MLCWNRVDTIQKDNIYHNKQHQTFYRTIKCDLLNFKEVQNGIWGFYSFFSWSGKANVKFYAW